MSKNENAPAVADESVSNAEIDYSILDEIDILAEVAARDAEGISLAVLLRTEPYIADLAKRCKARLLAEGVEHVLPDVIRARAEAYIAHDVIDDCEAEPNPHELSLRAVGDTITRALMYVSRIMGTTSTENGKVVAKGLFKVNPWLSDMTCAELIITWAHARMLCESDEHGRPYYSAETARPVVYNYGGHNEGIYTDFTGSEIAGALRALRELPPVSFTQNVEAQTLSLLQNDERYHVVEDKSPHVALFDDGIVDTDAKEFRAFTPEVVRLRKLPYGWADAPDACGFTTRADVTYDHPVDLIRSWVADDAELRLLLEVLRLLLTGEQFGYVLTLLNAQGANGKSAFINICRAMVGAHATLEPKASELGSRTDRFVWASLPGKRLILLDDTDGTNFLEQCSDLKTIATGGHLKIEKKGKDKFSYAPNVVSIFAGNNPLLARDKTQGWLRRQIMLTFSAHFDEKTRDPRIGEWSTSPEFCACLARYLIEEVGRFSPEHIPASCRENLKAYQRENDSVFDFCETVVDALPSKANPDDNGGYCDVVLVNAAYRGYRAWLQLNRPNASAANSREFGRSLREWAEQSPNWSAEIDGTGSLRRYSPHQPQHNNRSDTKLFRLADHWDNREHRNVVEWLRAGDQAAQGRGIVRAYPDGEPVTQVQTSTPQPGPMSARPFGEWIPTEPVEPEETDTQGRTLAVVGEGTFVRSDGAIWRPGASEPLVEPYDGVELTRAELEGLACFGRAHRDAETGELVAAHL